MDMKAIDARISLNKGYLNLLLSAPAYKFDSKLHSIIPEEPGIYRIFLTGSRETLRAGTTKQGNSLHQRIYRNHLMGDQKGNLRAQLFQSGICSDMDRAKLFIKNNCSVQWIVVKDNDERKWAEHFMLAILQPRFSD